MVKKKTIKATEVDTLDDFDPIQVALQLGLNEKPMVALKSIDDLLSSEEALVELVQLVANGASTSTVDMTLGLQPGMTDKWLRLGIRDSEGPFRIFYLLYSKAAASARSVAETTLLQRTPEKWLERIDIIGQLSREPDSLPGIDGPQVLEAESSTSLAEQQNNGLTFIEIPTPDQEDKTD